MSSSLLNNDVKKAIRTMILKGEMIKNIQAELDINCNTWDSWVYDNFQGFRDFYTQCKKERFLLQAERVSSEIMSLDASEDARLRAIQQKESEFLRETLGKDIYSKKTEIDQQQPITINVNSLKDRLPEPIDTQPKALQSDVAQYTLSPQSDSGNTAPLIENDVKQLTDTE